MLDNMTKVTFFCRDLQDKTKLKIEFKTQCWLLAWQMSFPLQKNTPIEINNGLTKTFPFKSVEG